MAERRRCRGLLIVFEGLDGAGKTTQLQRLAARLAQAGYDVVCLKEPSSGPWGQKIRQLAAQGRRAAQELEWFLADRRDNVEHHIAPALAQGKIVLLDRYYFSTMAYQGALGYDPAVIQKRNEAFAPPPDLVLLLEVPAEVGLERLQRPRDAFEELDYLRRVEEIFARLHFPTLRRIPGTLPPEEVHARVWAQVQALLARQGQCVRTKGK
ncbi:MAG: thymidylate kinase [Candidatus Tectimicrobiota bacterium]|nr:MAG: thymidylate kinase [Candidatus Tectomicrobia bacterium]